MNYTEAFLHFLHSLPDSLIYIMLGLSAFVENIFPPIPGDTITAFGAFLVGIGRLHFLGVYISTTLGSLAGFFCLFGIGGYLGRNFFIERDFRFFKAKDIIRAEDWFSRYGYFLVAVNRFLPGIRSAISLAAGITGFKTAWVVLLALLSCGVWNLGWILMGYVVGSNWELAKDTFTTLMFKYNVAVFALLALVIILFIIRKWYVRRRKS